MDLGFICSVVGIRNVKFRLLLDLLLYFFALGALEECGRFLSLLLLDFLEIQEAKMRQSEVNESLMIVSDNNLMDLLEDDVFSVELLAGNGISKQGKCRETLQLSQRINVP